MMRHININKGLFWMGVILSIIFLFLTNIFSWVNDKDYNYLLTLIGYKWQLTFFVVVILGLILALIYKNVFQDKTILESNIVLNENFEDNLSSNISNNVNEQDEIMNNLSSEEKDIISQYLKKNTKSLDFYDSAVLRTLVKNRVLFNPYNSHMSGNKRDFTLEEWSWKHINKNPTKFN